MGFSPPLLDDGTPNSDLALELYTLTAACYWNQPGEVNNMLSAIGGGIRYAFSFQNVGYPPSWTVVRSGNTVVLAFSGTVNFTQMVGDVAGAIGVPYTGTSAQAHGFFLGAWERMRSDILGVLPNDLATCTVIFTGHSYGAAVAMFGALDFKRNGFGADVQNFGIAKPKILTQGFSGPLPSVSLFIGSDYDIVPVLPPSGMLMNVVVGISPPLWALPVNWTHVCDGWTLDYGANITKQERSYFDRACTPAQIQSTFDTHPGRTTGNLMLAFNNNQYAARTNRHPCQQILERIIRQPNPQSTPPNPDLVTYMNLPYQNAQNFVSSPSAPLTPANALTVASVSVSRVNTANGNGIFTGATGGSAMSAAKITFFLQDGLNGFSETYYKDGAVAADIPLSDLAAYAVKRMAVSGNNTTMLFARVAQVNPKGPVVVFQQRQLIPDGTVVGTYGEQSDFSNTALLINKNPQNQAARLYLRGIPDSVVGQGGQYTPASLYQTLLQQFFTLIISKGWGYRGNTGGASQLISSAVQNADQTALFTLAGALFTGKAPGTKVSVRISGVNQPSNMNGAYTVVVNSDYTCTTLNQLNVSSFVPNNGKMAVSSSGVVGIVNPKVLKIAGRKAGRPSGSSRGRARKKTVR